MTGTHQRHATHDQNSFNKLTYIPKYHKLLNLRMTVDLLIAILSTLKLLFAQTILSRLPILILLLKLWNFVCSLKFPSSFSSTQSFKQFVYKTMFTTLVNTCTYGVERSCTCTLVMTCPCHRLKWLCLPPPLSCTFFFFYVNVHLGFELNFFQG